MAKSTDVLLDGFSRIAKLVDATLAGLRAEDLAVRIDPDANSIAWLIWHLTRVEDDHVAEVAGREQVWTKEGFADAFALGFDAAATGYGQTSEEVGKVVVGDPSLLADYHHAVMAMIEAFVAGLDDEDLDRIVDRRFDPPVSLGVRLVSVLSDSLQHVGQAAFVRGILERTTR